MTTTDEHNQLKEYAKLILNRLGFEKSEIFEEYTVNFEGMRERMLVDIAGVSQNRKVAIECGHTPSDKVIKLNLYFDEVILLPYFKSKVSDQFIGTEKNMAIIITNQEKQINQLTNELKKAQSLNKELQASIKNTNSNMQNEIYTIKKGIGYLIFEFLDRMNCLPDQLIDNYNFSNVRSNCRLFMEKNNNLTSESFRELYKQIEESNIVEIDPEP
jgi:hypothetical protein